MTHKINEKCITLNKIVSFEIDTQRIKNGNGLDRVFQTKRCLMDCKYKKTCPLAYTEKRFWA